MNSNCITQLLYILCLTSTLLAQLPQQPESPTPVTHPQIQAELLARAEEDQQIRKAYIEFMREHAPSGTFNTNQASPNALLEYKHYRDIITLTDHRNALFIQKLVEKHGWPTPVMIGNDGIDAACLLIQHADHDRKLQRKCLDLITRLPAGSVSSDKLALLTDRVLLAEGNKQRYGTQFNIEEGKLVMRPLEDPENVDTRREKLGLPSLAEYQRELEKLYGIKTE